MAALRQFRRDYESGIIEVLPIREVPKKKTNKKKGESATVDPFQPEDVKKLLDYFAEKGSWNHYFILVLGCNTARRCGDILTLRWENFYDDKGKLRERIKEFAEDKTDKLASPFINQAVVNGLNLYIEKTGIDPSLDGYGHYVFEQTSGKGKGSVLDISTYRKALKAAGEKVGIEYNIGTHSARKFFGMMTQELNPGDSNSMEVLQEILNHSDAKTTRRYIGITKETMKKYYNGFGDFFTDYVVAGKKFEFEGKKATINLTQADLISVIQKAFNMGNNSENHEMSAEQLAEMLAFTEERMR